MNERKQDNSTDSRRGKKRDRVVAAAAVFTPPSQDEEAFLKDIEQASEGYDPKVIVGGPSNFSA